MRVEKTVRGTFLMGSLTYLSKEPLTERRKPQGAGGNAQRFPPSVEEPNGRSRKRSVTRSDWIKRAWWKVEIRSPRSIMERLAW